MNAIIEVEGLSKRLFRRQTGSFLNDNLRETLVRFYGRLANSEKFQSVEFYALKDVSFSLQAGESLMLIGRNGAGKSTLLKILARITRPSTGRAKIRGRVVSVLGVGAGFNSELTGRENVYLYSSLLGMSRREISASFDEIVSFADIGSFLDTPIKRYSTGMQMRLGFAVATHVPADVILLDEVLAVGDAAFRKKCIKRLSEMTGQGMASIMVTHNIEGAKEFCRRALLLESGSVASIGEVEVVVREYENSLSKST